MLILHLPERAVGRRRAAALRALAGRFLRWCLLCHARIAQRRHLTELDEHMLKDAGITREQANAECAKPWWRA